MSKISKTGKKSRQVRKVRQVKKVRQVWKVRQERKLRQERQQVIWFFQLGELKGGCAGLQLVEYSDGVACGKY